MREHEEIVRAALKEHGGTEISTSGDGFFASFGSSVRALQCAVEMQRALAQRNETAEHPAEVRIGLNAGEPIEEGKDVLGTAVTMAARIMSQAGAGEILVSDVLRQLVAGKGFLFADRGEFVAKGFEDATRMGSEVEGMTGRGYCLAAARSFGLPSPSLYRPPLRMTDAPGFEEPVRVYEVRWRE
jgi:adenylate cyclase